MSLGYVLIGFILLVAGGEFLVRSSVGISLKLNLSRMIIGLTVVSFATSAPELLVSLQAALKGSSGIALGNVIGSNIANIGLVLGLTAIIAPLSIDRDFFKFNWPWMMGFSILLYGLLYYNKDINRIEGFVLLAALVLFLWLLIKRAHKKSSKKIMDDDIQESNWWKIAFYLFAGGALLWGGSELLVSGATSIATFMSIPESVIAVSMVSIGTSVPELAASIIAALKKEKAISLGNLIGSNIFNIGSVLGITAIVQPIILDESISGLLKNDMLWMLGFAFCLLPLAIIPKSHTIGSYKGLIVIGTYGLFIYLVFSSI
ncbi:MAG: calcium/sodium antiporter [Nonlabens sp.]